MIKGRTTNKVEVGKKRKIEVSSRYDKRRRFTKHSLEDQKYGGRGGIMWCEMCKKNHNERCDGEVSCYKYGRIGHYSKDCTFENKKCYEYGNDGHISKNCTKKNQIIRANAPPKPKARASKMILEKAGENARDPE